MDQTFRCYSIREEEQLVKLAATEKIALIVDDEVFARLFAAQILLDEGYTVLEVGDAAEGLEALKRNDDISVLFTDISMPGAMDGIALAKKVHEERPEIALILTSGRIEPSAGEIPVGGKFLAKPYTALALMSTLAALG